MAGLQAARKRYHHGNLRAVLVERAEGLIASAGPARLGLREVARLAGVSVAAPYRHFADREALLAAVLEKGFRELAQALEEARRAAGSPLGGLAAAGVAYVRFATRRPGVYRLMFGPGCDKAAHPELLAAAQAARQALARAVDACADAGQLEDFERQELVLASWSLCHGLASLGADGLLVGGPAAADRAARNVIRMLFKGVVRRTAPAAQDLRASERRPTP
jgi:AcrR family transcriptional regulator